MREIKIFGAALCVGVFLSLFIKWATKPAQVSSELLKHVPAYNETLQHELDSLCKRFIFFNRLALDNFGTPQMNRWVDSCYAVRDKYEDVFYKLYPIKARLVPIEKDHTFICTYTPTMYFQISVSDSVRYSGHIFTDFYFRDTTK